ncbi:DNA repair protein rad2 [Irineochytrium annulatum]|nr:DNA repair protein rad2 [Irineochytrium annulatum]
MGVKGLWQLIEPASSNVRLETLAGKKVAVDASIWLHQFLKAMRDAEGNPVRGAHILGFFRRICKLLFNGIRPIFVFDGSVPTLKRATVAARRRRRTDADSGVAKTAEKLLQAQLQLRAVGAANAPRKVPSAGTGIDDSAVYMEDTVISLPTSRKRKRKKVKSKKKGASTAMDSDDSNASDPEPPELAPAEPTPSPIKITPSKLKKRRDDYELPPLDEIAATVTLANDPRLADERELHDFIQTHRNSVDLNSLNLDSTTFSSIPVERQYQIILELKTNSRQASSSRVNELMKAPTPIDFSLLQIRNLVHRNTLTEKLFDIAKTGGVTTNPALAKRTKARELKERQIVVPKRVASMKGREYVLIKNDDAAGAGHTMAWREQGFTRLVERGKISGKLSGFIQRERKITEIEIIDSEDEGGGHLNTVQEADEEDDDEDFEEVKVDEGVLQSMTVADEGEDMAYMESSANAAELEDVDYLHFDCNSDCQMADYKENGGVRAFNGTHAGSDNKNSSSHIGDNVSTLDIEGLFKEGEYWRKSSGPSAIPVYEATISNDWDHSAPNLVDADEKLAGPDISPLDITGIQVPPLPAGLSGGDMLNYWVFRAPQGLATYYPNYFDFMEEAFAQEDEELLLYRVLATTRRTEKLPSWERDGPKVEAIAFIRAFLVACLENLKMINEPLFSDDEDEPLLDQAPFSGERKESKLASLPESPARQSGTLRIAMLEQRAHLLTSVSSNSPSMAHEAPSIKVEPNFSVLGGVKESDKIGDWSSSPCKRPAVSRGSKASWVENDRKSENSLFRREQAKLIKTKGPEKSSPVVKIDVIPPPLSPVVKENESGGREETLIDVDRPKPEPKAEADVHEDMYSMAEAKEATDAEEGYPSALSPYSRAHGVAKDLDDSDSDDLAEDVVHEAPSHDDDDEERLGVAPAQPEEDEEFAKFVAQIQNKGLDEVSENLIDKMSLLVSRNRKDKRDADTITSEMIQESQQLLKLFGLPYIIAPMEAESQCAWLLSNELVDGIITDDSDVFLFGGNKVYKNVFNVNKYVEVYSLDQLEKAMGLQRRHLILLAYLLGSDYTDGVPTIGYVTAMEILREFADLDKGDEASADSGDQLQFLASFSDWVKSIQLGLKEPRPSAFKKKFRKRARALDLPEGFPDPRVFEAYLNPQVDTSMEEFVFGQPDLEGIKEFLEDKAGHPPMKTTDVLLPVIREMDKRRSEPTQAVLGRFFEAAGAKTHQSVRVQSVVNALKRQDRPINPLPVSPKRPAPRVSIAPRGKRRRGGKK